LVDGDFRVPAGVFPEAAEIEGRSMIERTIPGGIPDEFGF
jgi:hypothetical protein